MSVAFNAASYLAANPDLVTAGITEANAFSHFANSGQSEGRLLTFDAAAYRVANPDLTSLSDSDAAQHYVSFVVFGSETRLLSITDYKAANPDLASLTDTQAVEHFFATGINESSRLASFEADAYLAGNADLVAAGLTTANALDHYLAFGASENRQFFDGDAYLVANQDVALAGFDPEAHFLAFGAAENRTFTTEAPTTVGSLGNSAPVANDDAITVATGTTTISTPAATLLSNDTDANGDTLTITGVTGASGGEAGLVGSSVIFVPNSGATSGSYTYTASDGKGGTDTATVTVSLNDAPVGVAFSAAGTEDTTATGSLTGTDAEGATLTFAAVDGTATGGAVTVSSDGTFTFIPTANFNGAASFQFTANDGLQDSAAQTATLNIAPVNDVPVTVDGGTQTVVAGTPLTVALSSFANDPDGDTLTFTPSTTVTNGVLVDNGDGTVTYTSSAGQSADDTVSFTATDGTDSVSGSFVIDVTNSAPTAVDDTATVLSGTSETIAVLANDTLADSTQTLTVASTTTPSSGLVSIASDGSSLTYTSTPGFSGSVSFTYTISDGFGGESTANVAVTVNTQTGGTSGNDTLVGSPSAETLEGGAGNDTIDGGSGNDQIDGGTGDDLITIRGSETTVTGNSGIDTLKFVGTTTNTTSIDFNQGGDQALVGTNDPVITAFENLDASAATVSLTVTDGTNTNSLITGSGNDTIISTNANVSTTVTLSGGDSNDVLDVDQTNSATSLSGGAGNDVLLAQSNADTLDGGTGNDTLVGNGGADSLTGGAGDDTLIGGGNADVVNGGDGNDTFLVTGTAGFSASTLTGGSGTDRILFNPAGVAESAQSLTFGSASGTAGLVITAGAFANVGTVETLEFSGNSAVTLTVNDTTMTNLGTTTLNVVSDQGDLTPANDLIIHATALTATNNINATFGNSGGVIQLNGGAGADTLTLDGITGGTFSAFGVATAGSFDGNGGTDTLVLDLGGVSAGLVKLGSFISDVEVVKTSGALASGALTVSTGDLTVSNSTLTVDASTMTGTFNFVGNAENDGQFSIVGGSGNDSIMGANGNDTINAGAGNDTIVGVSGADLLIGGAGNDVFVFGESAGVDFSSADTVSGGAGTDALQFDGSSLTFDSGALGNISSVESLRFNTVSAATITVSDASFTALGITTLNISDGRGSGGAETNNLFVSAAGVSTANALNVSLLVNGTSAAAVMRDVINGGAGNDTLTFGVSGTGGGSALDEFSGVTFDGNGGTDTLVLDLTGASGGTILGLATVRDVEVIKTDDDDANLTIVGSEFLVSSTGTLTIDASSMGTKILTTDLDAVTTGGDFSIVGASGNDVLAGGSGNDTIVSNNGADSISGGLGNDSIVAGDGNDTIRANDSANDTSNDIIFGGSGNDFFKVSATKLGSADSIIGGAGTSDVLQFTGPTASVQAVELSNVSGIETLQFGSSTSAATIALADSFFTANGSTSITIQTDAGFAGTLAVDGSGVGSANGVFVDFAVENENVLSVSAGAGNDTISLGSAAGGASAFDHVSTFVLNGGSGTDTLVLDLTGASGAIALSFASMTNVESIITSDDDAASLSITLADVNASTGTTITVDATSLATKALTFTAASENDANVSVVGASGADNITGGSVNDILSGAAGNDTAVGGAGNDSVDGGAGNDSLLGGTGADTLVGGAGNDILNGGTGIDSVVGGDGNDIFVMQAADSSGTTFDVISDFATGDQIQINMTVGTNVTDFNLQDAGNISTASDQISALSTVRGEFFFNTSNNSVGVDTDGSSLVNASDLTFVVAGASASDIGREDFNFRINMFGVSSGYDADQGMIAGSVISAADIGVALSVTNPQIQGLSAGDVLDFSGVLSVQSLFSGQGNTTAFTAGMLVSGLGAVGSADGLYFYDSVDDLLVLTGGGDRLLIVDLEGYDGAITSNGDGTFTFG